jgi:hypothetical protein
LVHLAPANGGWLGSIPRLSAHARGILDEVGRGLLGRAEAKGLNSLDRCTYAAGISVRVDPAVAAVVAGSGRHSSSRDTVIRIDDETRLVRHSAAS